MSVLGFGNRSNSQGLSVFRARDVIVCYGVNYGEPISFAEELQPDDVYQIAPRSAPRQLMLQEGARLGDLAVANGSELGTPSAPLCIDSVLTLMTGCGKTFEVFLIVELEKDSAMVADIYVMPLSEMRPQTDYTLVSVDQTCVQQRFAGLAYSSFVRGTRIAMASGEQRQVEDIKVGDTVFTCDSGPQRVRWVGKQRMRAGEGFAPVMIAAGALRNDRDLWVSPNQRLLVGQTGTGEVWGPQMGIGGAEALVSASLLVNGDTITRTELGFVEYHQILLDSREYLIAEGVAAESLTVDGRMLPALPVKVQKIVARQSPSLEVELNGPESEIALPQSLARIF